MARLVSLCFSSMTMCPACGTTTSRERDIFSWRRREKPGGHDILIADHNHGRGLNGRDFFIPVEWSPGGALHPRNEEVKGEDKIGRRLN
jgi:hypothetical protein